MLLLEFAPAKCAVATAGKEDRPIEENTVYIIPGYFLDELVGPISPWAIHTKTRALTSVEHLSLANRPAIRQ